MFTQLQKMCHDHQKKGYGLSTVISGKAIKRVSHLLIFKESLPGVWL